VFVRISRLNFTGLSIKIFIVEDDFASHRLLLFCFLDRAFSIMKTKK